jgi:hypothetical protein
MWITKASGKLEKFNVNKVRRTCMRAGAARELADKVAKQVQQRVRNGMSSSDILNMTLSMLRREMPDVAARYDLKGALLRLGPTGFIFEELIAQLLREHGYSAKVHSLIKGGSGVIHEVDVIAVKTIKKSTILNSSSKVYSIECKYHNSPGIFTGIKDVLYTYARFLDLQDGFKAGTCQKFDQPWLVTNTRFSRDVLQYAVAKNLRLMSWDYPAGESLRDMIDQKKLYPITVLRTLDVDTGIKFANANIVFVNTLLKTSIEKLNQKTGVPVKKLKELILEAQRVMA